MGAFLKNKTVLIGVGVLALLAVSYFFFFSGSDATPTAQPFPSSSPLLSSTPAAADQGTLGHDLITLLDQLRAIRLDETFFSRDDYASLTDWSSPIPLQEVGRRNPFLKLAGSPPPVVPSSTKKSSATPKVVPPADSGFLESF